LQLKTYTGRERTAYMSGIAGQNIIFNVMIVFTSFFMVHVLYIPALTVGIILVLTQIFDAVTDPFMGIFVDRTKTRFGKCRPWLMVTPGIIFALVMLSFAGGVYQYGPDASALQNAGVVAWVTSAYILWGLVYMAGDITLWGISSLMTEDETHRKKLQALARTAATIGAGVAMLGFQPVALAVGNAIDDLRLGFILTALGFGVLGTVTYQLVGIFCKEKISPPKMETKVLENFKMAWNNKPFRRLLLSGVFAAPRNLVMIVAIPLVTYYFANMEPGAVLLYTVLIGGGVAVGTVVIMPFVPRLLERWSKRTLYIWSLLLDIPTSLMIFALFLVSVFFDIPGGLTNMGLLGIGIVLFFVKGLSMGLFMVLQTNMINDSVDFEDYTNHRRPDGLFFSGQTFIVKVGNGICNLLFLSLSAAVMFTGTNLQILQHMEQLAEENYEQITVVLRDAMQRGYDGAVLALDGVGYLTGDRVFWFFAMMFFCISVLPAIGAALAIIPMRNYELTDEKHKEILQALQQRRREEGELAEA